MLVHLSISNYALIETLEVDFSGGFTVITGETGAGKSIILGALALILGQRADLQVLMDKNNKCIVEGVFDIHHLHLQDFFKENDIDFQEQTIIRREILPSGKSRAFVNDTPVNLDILASLGDVLLDIHSQNKTVVLGQSNFQMTVIDSIAGNRNHLDIYRQKYSEYQALLMELERLNNLEKKSEAEQDYLRFQYDELYAAKLKPGEQQEIEQELGLLTHAAEIKNRLASTSDILDQQTGIIHGFSECIAELRKIRAFYDGIAPLLDRLESNYLDVRDISDEIGRLQDKIEVEPQRIELLNQRLDLLYRLISKHKAPDVDTLIGIREQFAKQLTEHHSLGNRISDLSSQADALLADLKTRAEVISAERKQAKTILENQIMKLIESLGMPKVRFNVEIQRLPEPGRDGQDDIRFLFNANQGGELKEISKIASGGELSRLMLAVKSLVASKRLLSTIIFDEIDSGVSGEIAGKMGSIMLAMSAGMQVITITHVPQIAARGNHHYLVYKEIAGTTTRTFLRQLPDHERILEIAKMMSNATVSNSAIATAKELLNN